MLAERAGGIGRKGNGRLTLQRGTERHEKDAGNRVSGNLGMPRTREHT